MNETIIKSYFNDLVKKLDINENELAYKYDETENKYLIYQNILFKIFEDKNFASRFNEIKKKHFGEIDYNLYEIFDDLSEIVKIQQSEGKIKNSLDDNTNYLFNFRDIKSVNRNYVSLNLLKIPNEKTDSIFASETKLLKVAS